MKFSKLLLAASLAVGFVASAAAQTTMRINISVAQNSHQGVGIDTFAREVEKRTGGRYKIQTFYSGALGAERVLGEEGHEGIAADLGLSRRTVDNALQRVFAKLGVRSRGELIDHVPESS